MKTCSTCKWWEKLYESPKGSGHYIGNCAELTELAVDDQPKFHVALDHTSDAWVHAVNTGQNFGCTEHEERDADSKA